MSVDRARRERERGDGRTWRERALDAEAELSQLREQQDDAIEEALLTAASEMFPDFDFSGCYDADDLRNHMIGQASRLREERDAAREEERAEWNPLYGRWAERSIAAADHELAGPDTPADNLNRHTFSGDPWGPCSACAHPAHHEIHRVPADSQPEEPT